MEAKVVHEISCCLGWIFGSEIRVGLIQMDHTKADECFCSSENLRRSKLFSV